MKWKDSDFNRDIQNIKAVLIYGADAGQIDEYCDKAIEKLNIDRDNLFSIDCTDLIDKQDAIFAECCSASMFGGNKLLIISNATESYNKKIQEIVLHPSLCSTVIVCAGELRADEGLRKLFENDVEKLAVLPCYTDNEQMIANLIRETLSANEGIEQITPDAMDYMKTHLGSDRGITRSFLAKIALYVSDKKIVELEDVEKCLPDTGASNIDEFLYSLTAGHMWIAIIALDRLFYDNIDPNMLLRMLNAHFKKLLTTIVTGQVPHLFWKVADKFTKATQIWTAQDIESVLVRLNELEKQFRTTGMPAEILFRDFSLKLAMRASKLAVRRK